MSSSTSLAQYACDVCKQRKLRCSREIPVCGSCNSSATECVYSRHGRIRRRPRSNVPLQDLDSSSHRVSHGYRSPDSLGQRLSLVEVQQKPRAFNKDTEEDGAPESCRSYAKFLIGSNGQSFYIGPSPVASFLSQASSNIDTSKDTLRDPILGSNAEESLSELSETFAAVNFQDAADVRRNVRNFRQSREIFFIPGKEEGLQLIELFVKGIEKGQPFFVLPPPDLLPKLIFEPSRVEERCWLLLFNAYLSTTVASMKSQDMRLTRGFQWNTWMLLEDASIFLEPSEISIQTLLLVAAHGQEITTPSLCWTLIGQASLMAQTIGLHVPTPREKVGSEDNSRRNCLFWGLFNVDKSLSLAFGRPPLLPAYLYRNVPLPNPEYLARYQPHQKSRFPSSLSDGMRQDETFGRFHFMQHIALAKLQGRISEMMYGDGRPHTEKLTDLKQELDMWLDNIQKSSPVYIKSSINPSEQDEIKLGINVFIFQYHHLMVYLTRADQKAKYTCLESARAAISLLGRLVSSSEQVFNGIVWQLLYQPFTPYFVLFANIISNPSSPDCFEDLQLLRQVVLYFLKMHNNHPSAGKLEKIAETFTRLAEAYVRQSMEPRQSPLSTSFEIATETSAEQTSAFGMPPPKSSNQEKSSPSIIFESASQFSSMPSFTTSEHSFPTEIDFDDPSSDPMTLLNFFSTSNYANVPASDNSYQDQPMTESAPNELPQKGSEVADWSSDSLMRELRNIGQNPALDCTFDWFSWEQYDAGMG